MAAATALSSSTYTNQDRTAHVDCNKETCSQASRYNYTLLENKCYLIILPQQIDDHVEDRFVLVYSMSKVSYCDSLKVHKCVGERNIRLADLMSS